MVLGSSLELTDELVNEFVEKYKDNWVDPEQYPNIFGFRLKTFMYVKSREDNG